MINHIKNLDWILTLYAVLLVCFGLVSLYGSGYNDDFLNFKKQLFWLFTGLFSMIFISFFDYRILKNRQFPIVLLFSMSLLLLLGLFQFGDSIRGTTSWYRIGPVAFEPVEVVKIVLIVVLAKYFSMRHVEMYRFRHILISGFYMLAPVSVVLIQSEVGSAMVMVSIWLGIMLMAGIQLKHLVGLFAAGVVILFLAWNWGFQDYQKERILSFINPGSDPQGSGYNVLQSMIAIGSGGFWGKGIGEGGQTQLGFLPESQTDFIYSAIAEEMGLLGALLLLCCFALFVKRIMSVSRNSENNFARLVASAFSVMLLAQIFVNVGMTFGLFPITGIPFPFVSYGGSSLVSLFAMLGILQSVKSN